MPSLKLTKQKKLAKRESRSLKQSWSRLGKVLIVEVMLLLGKLAQEMGKSIFLSTHDLDLALQTADRLWLMAPSGCQMSNVECGIAVGTPRELASELPRFFPSRHLDFDAEALRFNIQPLPLTLPEGRE